MTPRERITKRERTRQTPHQSSNPSEDAPSDAVARAPFLREHFRDHERQATWLIPPGRASQLRDSAGFAPDFALSHWWDLHGVRLYRTSQLSLLSTSPRISLHWPA